MGEVKSIKQGSSFNTSIDNGVTTVELNYTIEFGDQSFNEQFILRKKGDEEFMIMGYFIE